MRLILIGAPASGKGTQATLLTQHFSICHISTGDMLREAVAQNSELGQVLATYLKHGWLVPDHHVMQLVDARLSTPEAANGFVLDGFPRTLSQSLGLDQNLASRSVTIDAAILIEVEDDIMLERITGRRSDPETGRIYHLKFDPPPAEIVDRLQQREDDTEEVMQERLATYYHEIGPVIDHYDRVGHVIKVDGSRAPEEVLENTLRSLEALAEGNSTDNLGV